MQIIGNNSTLKYFLLLIISVNSSNNPFNRSIFDGNKDIFTSWAIYQCHILMEEIWLWPLLLKVEKRKEPQVHSLTDLFKNIIQIDFVNIEFKKFLKKNLEHLWGMKKPV